MYRLLRIGVRAAWALDEHRIIISIGSIIYELNLENGELSSGYYCGEGIRPLIFTQVKGVSTIEESIYFGGYLNNMGKKSVHVYKRTNIDCYEVVYTFPFGSINHIHAIVNDPYRDCLWILTGDFGKAAAIWKVTENFKSVKRVGYNCQKYRGCVAFAIPEGLLYATDAPFTDNFIFLMNPSDYSIKAITAIYGSCIYGTQWKDQYVFSTTVEGDGRNTSRFEFWFGRKRGAGIKDKYVHMYCGTIKEGFHEIYKEEKDNMPYYTFQFGVFKFPYGENKNDKLYFQPIATKKNDLSLIALNKIDSSIENL